MKSLDISDVVARSGFKASALRYYETLGLITSDGRKGLRRQYDETVLNHLALISLGQSAGFSLDEIGSAFQQGGAFDIDRDRLLAKAEDVEQQIRKLTTLARALHHVAVCPEPNHSDCPTFRRMMQDALKIKQK